MSITIKEQVEKLGYIMPPPTAPVANYVSTVRSGNQLIISGMLSRKHDGELVGGHLGSEVDLEGGRRAAELAAIHVLSHLAAATDGFIKSVRRVVRLGVFVASTPEFKDHPQVANGASDLMVAVFGDAGRHARAAVGVSALPVGAAVEVEAIIELEAAV